MDTIIQIVGTVIVTVILFNVLSVNLQLYIGVKQNTNSKLGSMKEWRNDDRGGVMRFIAPLAPQCITTNSQTSDQKQWFLDWQNRIEIAMVNFISTPLFICFHLICHINSISRTDEELFLVMSLILSGVAVLLTVVNTVLSLNVILSWRAVELRTRV